MINIVLVIALSVSLFTDIHKRRIYNVITLPCIFFGLIYHLVDQGLSGVAFSGLGMLTGLMLLIIPFAMGGIGAGDVKLLAAIGSCMGAAFVLNAFIYIAMIGGLLALVILVRNNGLKNTYRSIVTAFALMGGKPVLALRSINSRKLSFPYGVAIVFGTIITLMEINGV